MIKKFTAPLLAVMLAMATCVVASADTIRLKDGSVIQGQVIGYKDQQFTVLIGSGSRNRRSRILLYAEDVESIEFDAQAGASAINSNDNNPASIQTVPAATQSSRPSASQPLPTQPTTSRTDNDDDDNNNNATQSAQPSANSQGGAPRFMPIKSFRVAGDNTTNGWTNSGFVVTRGQRLRITATGRVMLGAGRVSTPAGLPTQTDTGKLMRNEATGALIAVIGDDNDEFIYIGRSREFVAQRDGILFLGVNEGNLNDNTGSYEVTLEAESR